MSRVLSVVLRVLAIAIVVVSPWLPAVRRPSAARSVVYVVDRSASIGEQGLGVANDYLEAAWKAAPADARLGVIAFDGRAELVVPIAPRGKTPSVALGTESSASDLAGAIRLAIAALPLEGHRSIVLLTDARPTRGDAHAEVTRAAERGIRVDVVGVEGPTPSLPLVTAVRAHATHVAENQPVSLDVDVRADKPFRLFWTRDGVPLHPHNEYRHAGTEGPPITLVDSSPPPGVHVYDVRAVGFGRQPKTPPSDAAIAAVTVDGKAQAAVFSSTGDVPPVLKAALAESGLEARSLPVERAADPSSYTGADLVVLADVRVSGAAADDTGLTRAAQSGLVDYVQQGGGLLVTGGVFGLAPEYAGTPIARTIPVEIEDRGHVEDPPVSLAIMLDRSGSMAAQVGTHTKIELAIEASIAAADTLRPSDQIAIASVDTETHWDVELGPQSRLAELRTTVRKVTAGGGGIYVYTALKDAYAALEGTKTPIRHVILFSDTSDSEEQAESCPWQGCAGKKPAEQLAKEARIKGITTTVVGIGEESAKDTEFLRRLAAASGGRFYLTTEGADLRRIFLSETRVLAQSNLREKKTAVTGNGTHPALEGIDTSKLPELAAYVETGRRAGADTALLLAEGRPMLATWRYGLGKVGAIATDLSEGVGGEWAASPEGAKVLRQTARFLARQSAVRRADATVRLSDRMVEVEIELPADAPDNAAPASLDVFMVAPTEGEQPRETHKLTMRLEQRGPGRWVARGRSAGEPIAIVRARDARGALMAEAVGREDRVMELSGVGADTYEVAELARIGEGRVDPTPPASLVPTSRPERELAASWPYALLAASVLVVLDLILRRLGEPKRRRAAVLLERPRESEFRAAA
jgi:uncharacterized membrane protein